MVQSRGRAAFVQHPSQLGLIFGVLVVQDLDGYFAVETNVARTEDRAKSPSTQFLLDAVMAEDFPGRHHSECILLLFY